MNSYEAFLKYRDVYGLNGLDTNGTVGLPSQNGALFTMEYLICLMADPEVSDWERDEEVERIRTVFHALDEDSGTTVRRPFSSEIDSMDNVSALLVFSALFGSRRYATQMWNHGQYTRARGIADGEDYERNFQYYPIAWVLSWFKPPRFFWNNQRPEEFSLPGWYGRSPGFLALARLCATDKLSFFGGLALWIGQFAGCFSATDNTDARKLPYVTWQLLKRRNWFWELSYVLWCGILMWQYPEGMRSVYGIYYRDTLHPIKTKSKPYVGV